MPPIFGRIEIPFPHAAIAAAPAAGGGFWRRRAQLQALAEGDSERVVGHAEGEQDEGPGGHRGSGDGRVGPASVPRDHSTLVSRGAAEQADSAIVSISAIRSGRPI